MLNEDSVYEIAFHSTKQNLVRWEDNLSKREQTFNHFDVLFPNARQIHSIVQSGLTSFGSNWEKLAYDLASANGYKTFEKNDFNKNVPVISEDLKEFQQKMRRKFETEDVTLDKAIDEIRKFIIQNKLSSTERKKVESGKGIDFWFEKDGVELIGDIKSPQENIGNGKKLAEHILIWATYRLMDEPTTEIESVIAFPYNPYADFETYMSLQGQKFAPMKTGTDYLIADQFWEKLSGVANSTKIIFDAFEALSQSEQILRIKQTIADLSQAK